MLRRFRSIGLLLGATLAVAAAKAAWAQAPQVAAAVAVGGCRADIEAQETGEDAPGLPSCERQWRDIRITMYKDWSGNLQSVSAKDQRTWEYRCEPTRDECWLISANIRIGRGSAGYSLSWGRPGSPQTDSLIRLDDKLHFRVREDEGLGGPQSAAVIAQMKASTAATLEWHDWAASRRVQEAVDLSGFRNLISVFEAVHLKWRDGRTGRELAQAEF